MKRHQLGLKLQQLRKQKGWSQEELAIQLNVTRQAISNWERNKVQPDLEMLMKIADIFEIDLNELLGFITQVKKGNLNLKTLRILYVTQLISLTGYFLLMFISPIYYISGELILFLTFLLMSTTIYFTFTYSLRNGEYTMLAGYDKRINYHEPTLRKIVYLIAFYSLLTILSYTWIYIALTLLKIDLSGLDALLMIGFILQFIGGILFLNVKYRQELLLDKSAQEEARIGTWIIISFFSSILVMIAVLVYTHLTFQIENNTPEALKSVLFVLPYIFLNIVILLLEQGRLKKIIKENQKYHPHLFTYWSMVICVILLVGMIYTGYQNSLS